MLKRDLRLSHYELRATLSPEEIRRKSLAIAEQCRELPIWGKTIYHMFLSIPHKGEVDTSFLRAVVLEEGGRIAVPKVEPGRQLSHYILEEDPILKSNTWGVPEPVSGETLKDSEVDAVFLPLLAYDIQGYRVGYGGGYYDRFLSGCRAGIPKIGLSFFDPVERIDDLHADDIRMDYCVTPDSVFSF